MVGHDIRNPLQSIIGEIYLAKTELKNLPESSAKKCLEESCESIAKSVDYVNKIVMDLQDYAKKLKPIFQEISLKNFLAESLSRNDIPENIHTSYKVEANAKNISTDPTLLKRILDNLVMNAIQAMPKGGALTIHAFNKADRLCITIQDTGVGIPEDVKSKLFKPLFTTKSKGQGLGLAVVKRLTEAMNGNITFESNEGKGTTFTVELPMTGTA